MAIRKTRNPRAGGRRGSGKAASVSRIHITAMRRLYSTRAAPRISKNWPDRLPVRGACYGDHRRKLGKPNGEGKGEEHGR